MLNINIVDISEIETVAIYWKVNRRTSGLSISFSLISDKWAGGNLFTANPEARGLFKKQCTQLFRDFAKNGPRILGRVVNETQEDGTIDRILREDEAEDVTRTNSTAGAQRRVRHIIRHRESTSKWWEQLAVIGMELLKNVKPRSAWSVLTHVAALIAGRFPTELKKTYVRLATPLCAVTTSQAGTHILSIEEAQSLIRHALERGRIDFAAWVAVTFETVSRAGSTASIRLNGIEVRDNAFVLWCPKNKTISGGMKVRVNVGGPLNAYTLLNRLIETHKRLTAIKPYTFLFAEPGKERPSPLLRLQENFRTCLCHIWIIGLKDSRWRRKNFKKEKESSAHEAEIRISSEWDAMSAFKIAHIDGIKSLVEFMNSTTSLTQEFHQQCIDYLQEVQLEDHDDVRCLSTDDPDYGDLSAFDNQLDVEHDVSEEITQERSGVSGSHSGRELMQFEKIAYLQSTIRDLKISRVDTRQLVYVLQKTFVPSLSTLSITAIPPSWAYNPMMVCSVTLANFNPSFRQTLASRFILCLTPGGSIEDKSRDIENYITSEIERCNQIFVFHSVLERRVRLNCFHYCHKSDSPQRHEHLKIPKPSGRCFLKCSLCNAHRDSLHLFSPAPSRVVENPFDTLPLPPDLLHMEGRTMLKLVIPLYIAGFNRKEVYTSVLEDINNYKSERNLSLLHYSSWFSKEDWSKFMNDHKIYSARGGKEPWHTLIDVHVLSALRLATKCDGDTNPEEFLAAIKKFFGAGSTQGFYDQLRRI
ncbi:hypothetical protein ADUPG1_014023, partial [Aduncisulcus paluster]